MLANVVRKPMRQIFSEFSGVMPTSEGTGDVKYHLGTSYDRPTISGKRVHLSLLANPSHLEVHPFPPLHRFFSLQHTSIFCDVEARLHDPEATLSDRRCQFDLTEVS